MMSSDTGGQIHASIVMNVQGTPELGAYGFRSWMLQSFDRPYEVILNLFAEEEPKPIDTAPTKKGEESTQPEGY